MDMGRQKIGEGTYGNEVSPYWRKDVVFLDPINTNNKPEYFMRTIKFLSHPDLLSSGKFCV